MDVGDPFGGWDVFGGGAEVRRGIDGGMEGRSAERGGERRRAWRDGDGEGERKREGEMKRDRVWSGGW